MKDIIWLLRNGYKDVTEEMKLFGYAPTDTNWTEWAMGKRKFVTANNKFYEKNGFGG